MKFYVNVLDSWSNFSTIGPFETESEATKYAAGLPPAWDVYGIDETEVNKNVAEFGAIEIQPPEET